MINKRNKDGTASAGMTSPLFMTCADALGHFLDNIGTDIYWSEFFMLHYRITEQGSENYNREFDKVVDFQKML